MMNELTIIFSFIIWYTGALIISENTPKENKPGREWIFFISMIFSPVMGLILFYSTKKK